MNILFTSVGRRSYLVKYFKEALGDTGQIYVANSSALSPAFLAADHFVVTPLIYEERYIPFLLDYCRENNICAIISLFDIDLPILSRKKQLFRDAGVNVIASDSDVIDICNDKWKTYQFLKENSFVVPQTYLSLDSAVDSINQGIIQFPVIVKPRWGMGSIAVYEAEDMEELNVFYKKTLKTIQKTYLKYESQENLEQSVLIQERIQGQEYGLDIINDLEGKYQTTICKKKYAMRAGETDCAVTVNSSILRNIGEALSKKLRHVGNLDCDVFLKDGIPYVLEMNARFGGGYPFSHAAGVDLPRAIVCWLRGELAPEHLLKETCDVMAQKDISIVRMTTE